LLHNRCGDEVHDLLHTLLVSRVSRWVRSSICATGVSLGHLLPVDERFKQRTL